MSTSLQTPFHPAPLKEMARLRFHALSDADREVYPDVSDPQALIAYTDKETWIVEGDTLRIVHIDQRRLRAVQQCFVLEPWGERAVTLCG